MADTASYAGAMRSNYKDVAKTRQRGGSLQGGHPLGVHRSAAQKRVGLKKRQGMGARMQRPTPKANGFVPV